MARNVGTRASNSRLSAEGDRPEVSGVLVLDGDGVLLRRAVRRVADMMRRSCPNGTRTTIGPLRLVFTGRRGFKKGERSVKTIVVGIPEGSILQYESIDSANSLPTFVVFCKFGGGRVSKTYRVRIESHERIVLIA